MTDDMLAFFPVFMVGILSLLLGGVLVLAGIVFMKPLAREAAAGLPVDSHVRGGGERRRAERRNGERRREDHRRGTNAPSKK